MDPADRRCLTGKLDDGAAGLKAIDARGGFYIVQTPTDCAAPDRPTAAHEAVFVDVVALMNAISASIIDVDSALVRDIEMIDH
jgi:two-component system chemotaxis response regulator CheB